MATYQDFEKLDIRAGNILSVEDFPEALTWLKAKPTFRIILKSNFYNL